MSNEPHVTVLQEVFDGFNEHDIEAIMSHFAGDCVFESPRGPDPWGRRFAGRDEVRRGLAARFEGMPDVRYDDGDHFACGRRGVSEWTIVGTTPDGEHVEVRGCDLWTLTTMAASPAKTASGRSATAEPERLRNRLEFGRAPKCNGGGEQRR